MPNTPRPPSPKKAIKLCAYCGVRPSTKKGDHVLPLALFPDPKPPDRDLIVVPACRLCNEELSNHQDFLRDWLVTDFRCSSHPSALKLLEGPVSRSVGYKSSKLAKSAQKEGQLESFYTTGGIYLGKAYTVPFDGEVLNYLFSMMAKGLYYSRFGLHLPDGYSVEVEGTDSHNPVALYDLWEGIKRWGFNGPYRFGEDVCTCFWNYDAKDPAQTIWVLIFYEAIGIVLKTVAPEPAVSN